MKSCLMIFCLVSSLVFHVVLSGCCKALWQQEELSSMSVSDEELQAGDSDYEAHRC